MPTPKISTLLLAKDPRALVRFPDAPVDAAMAEWSAFQDSMSAPKESAVPDQAAAREIEAMMTSLCQVATNIWRAKTKMVDPVTQEPKEETRRLYRHVEGAMEGFAQMGLQINDLLNQPYDAGLPVKVLTYQPTPGVTRDTIIEVVRPSVLWKDRLLQVGEVVVGIPINLETDKK